MTSSLPRALAATMVAVVPEQEQDRAASVLTELCRTASVRPILVSLGDLREPERIERDGVILFRGLVPRYLNNVVASLRLSSLPSVGWWRSPQAAPLRDLAVLVDRLVLDADDPSDSWGTVAELATLTAVSDLRWGRLTRWRDLLAQFLDIPEVRQLQSPFVRLEVTGADRHDALLLRGWLRATLPGGGRLAFAWNERKGARLAAVRLSGPEVVASLHLLANGSCLESVLEMAGDRCSRRVVPLGDHELVTLLTDELKIRSRDHAFERAVQEALSS